MRPIPGLSAILAVLLGGHAIADDSRQSANTPHIERTLRWLKKNSDLPWQTIPWVASLTEARRLSREEHRPLFLFVYNGDLDSGRC
jgi:hypothetical protein